MKKERIMSVSALIVLGGSALYVLFGQSGLREKSHLRKSESSIVSFQNGPSSVIATYRTWALPSAQSRGEEWIFDLFTPPEIDYAENSRRWVVRFISLKKRPAPVVDHAPDDLILAEVKPAPYRLQLVGYSGSGEVLTGIFTTEGDDGLILSRAGRMLSRENVEIISIVLQGETPSIINDTTPAGRFVTAILRDLGTGKRIELDQFSIRTGDDLIACFEGKEGRWRVGEEIKGAQETYRITSLSAGPDVVELICIDGPRSGQKYILRTRS